jgi:MerR family transcriptional regulator/heat shock protein HspR
MSSSPSPIIPRDQTAKRLAVSPSALVRYEALGLIHSVRQGDVEGYPAEEIRRVWTVVSLHRDAGINLAGIEAVLRLRDQLDTLRLQMTRVADGLKAALEAEADDLEGP